MLLLIMQQLQKNPELQYYNTKMFKGMKFKKKLIICSKDETNESKEKTFFHKAPYFVLPVPALHSLMVPCPGEGDLEKVEGQGMTRMS